jgi:hypothetical protein
MILSLGVWCKLTRDEARPITSPWLLRGEFNDCCGGCNVQLPLVPMCSRDIRRLAEQALGGAGKRPQRARETRAGGSENKASEVDAARTARLPPAGRATAPAKFRVAV